MKDLANTFNRLLLATCFTAVGTLAFAAVEKKADVLKFKTWKNERIMKAQNQVVRLTNQILVQKNSKAEGAESPGWSSKEQSMDDVNSLLKQAKEDLQVAQELEFEDYLSVYLTSLGEDEAQLRIMAEKLSAEEVTKTLIYLQRYRSGGKKAQAKPQQP